MSDGTASAAMSDGTASDGAHQSIRRTSAAMSGTIACSAVWLPDPACVWAACEIVGSTSDDKLRVRMPDGTRTVVSAGDVIPKNPLCQDAVEDLASLTHLDEPNVLHNLRLRFSSAQIYTWTGKILMALNPWRNIDGLYSRERLSEYCSLTTSDASNPAPHVFAVANQAYHSMLTEQRPQCILVSGDSGSGKTETTKYLMQQLAAVSSIAGSAASDIGQTADKQITTERQVLDSNPLLEAFGNAKTLRNDNSSRFGKFLVLQFKSNSASGRPKISGASIRTYLLEKSRLVRVAAGERNYHIFHQLCQAATSPGKGPSIPSGLELEGRSFKILGQAIEDFDDHKRFGKMHDALVSIGVSPEEWSAILHAVAGLLHLGNLEFLADAERKGSSDVDTAVLQEDDSAKIAAKLLSCNEEALKASVLSRKVKTVEETVTVNYSREQAETARDALLKAVYGKIFHWMIERVNLSLHREDITETEHLKEISSSCEMQIGILDIFGFESFDVNGFEQFCINYANEKLQLQFNNFVFKLEQDEYKRENIPWAHIGFNDNQPCIDVIEGWPAGILATLDEECKVPRGSDDGFVAKARAINNPHIKGPKTSIEVFTVVHYAGSVSYNSKGFLERNKDSLGGDLVELIGGSKSTFLSSLFPSNMQGKPKIMGQETIGSQFKRQLSALMDIIESAKPHYIRCINSNSKKTAELFEPGLVVHQLRCGGVIEAVRVTRARYPARFLVSDFVKRFSRLRQSEKDHACQLHDIMKLAGLVEGVDYQVGISKVFLREGRVQTLQTRLANVVESSALRIACNVRVWLARKAVSQRIQALVSLQAVLRSVSARRWHMLSQSDKFATIIQSKLRRAVVHRPFCTLAAAARRIQTNFRNKNLAQLPKLLATLHENRSEIEELKALNCLLIEQLDNESAKVSMAKLETIQVQSDMACRLHELESQLHTERMNKEECEALVSQAEGALIRVRMAKDVEEEGRQQLLHTVEELKVQIETLAARIEDLEAENDLSKRQVSELTKQRTRLTKLCGLRPARSSGVSPRCRSPMHDVEPVSTPLPRSNAKTRNRADSAAFCPAMTNSRATPPLKSSSPKSSNAMICDTSFSPVITQDVLQGYVYTVDTPVSPSASVPVFGEDSTRQGSMIVFTASRGSQNRNRSKSPSSQSATCNAHGNNMSPTSPLAPGFGRHSAERSQRHIQRMSDAPQGGVGTPWKQEKRLSELAKKNQVMRSNIARAELRGNQLPHGQNEDKGRKKEERRSLDESKRRFSREQFILDQARCVPAFVTDALRKQLANKDGAQRPSHVDKENLENCTSPAPAAVEISMEATRANVSVTGSSVKKSARRRHTTNSGGPLCNLNI